MITEIMASNGNTLAAGDGNYYDWVELYNPTKDAINLNGYAVSDKTKKPEKFKLPEYNLGAGQFIVVFASKTAAASQDDIMANFNLSSAGRTVTLVNPNGTLLQSVTYPELAKDNSYAMDMSDPGKWSVTDKPTPGFPNTDNGYAEYLKSRHATSTVLIDELMTHNSMTLKDQDGEYSDWLELYNSSDKPVDLTGWGLSNKEDKTKKWMFPKTEIGPKQYLVVFCSGKNRPIAGQELHTSFKLNSYDDTVLLSNLRGQIVSEVKLDKLNLNADESWGLIPGTTDQWQKFSQPTPELSNDQNGWNTFQQKLYSGAANEPVVIEALMSSNATTLKDQFGNTSDLIELHNQSSKNVDLKGYGLSNRSNKPGRWAFPDVTLAPGEYMTVFASGQSVEDANAIAAKKLHTDFKLSSSNGDTVVLTAPDGHIADRCFLPPLRPDVAYARVQGKFTYSYVPNIQLGAPVTSGYPGMAPDPIFSVQAGMYDTDQTVSLSTTDPQAKIYYTLNGDPPTKNSTPYAGSIAVTKPSTEYGATVIRAVSYRDGYLPSDTKTSTYFIGLKTEMPIISISVDNDAMFNPTTGLYEKGPSAGAKYPFVGGNFDKRGKANGELPAHLEMFDPSNSKGMNAVSQDCGIQLFGQFSRGDAFKGFDLVARSVYGKSAFDYQVFPDLTSTTYKHIVSRPGGQDVKRTGMRDMLTISLARDTIPKDTAVGGPSVMTQDVRLALEYVNGEFWGVTTLHEHIDVHTIAKYYPGATESSIDLIDTTGKAKAGSNKDYKALIEYVKAHQNLSNPSDYKWVTDRMDIDSYINFETMEMCNGNSDYGNIRLWKSSALDNKFRWIYYDFCWAFDNVNRSDISLDVASVKASDNGYLLRALLSNPDFKEKFLKQMAYNINVTFEPGRVLQRINEIAAEMQPYMAAEDAKWHDVSEQGNNTTGAQGYSNWAGQVDLLRKYAQQHPALLKAQMQSFFALSDVQMQQFFSSTSAGK